MIFTGIPLSISIPGVYFNIGQAGSRTQSAGYVVIGSPVTGSPVTGTPSGSTTPGNPTTTYSGDDDLLVLGVL